LQLFLLTAVAAMVVFYRWRAGVMFLVMVLSQKIRFCHEVRLPAIGVSLICVMILRRSRPTALQRGNRRDGGIDCFLNTEF